MEKNTGKKFVTQGKLRENREFYLGWNVATLLLSAQKIYKTNSACCVLNIFIFITFHLRNLFVIRIFFYLCIVLIYMSFFRCFVGH